MEPKIEPSALDEAISALKVIRACLKADTGDVGEYWSAREWLRNHDHYEDNLQELAVPLEVAEVALMNIEALEHAPSSPAAPDLNDSDDLTRALILAAWPKRPDPERMARMMEGLLLEPYGGAHCVLCGGRINCADCRPNVPTGHASNCKMPEFLEFYLPTQTSSPAAPTPRAFKEQRVAKLDAEAKSEGKEK